MHEIETIEERYVEWFDKTQKNLLCTKGKAASELLARIQCLERNTGLLGCKKHIATFGRIVSEYTQERDTLRWAAKLALDCDSWRTVFESLISAHRLPVSHLVSALVNEDVDIDTAIGLVQW